MGMLKIMFGVLILIVFGMIEANAMDKSICASEKIEEHYPDGSLRSCVLKDTFRSNGIKCNSQSQISFYENGQIETCILAEPVKISGQECKEFGPISFYPDGKFKSCVKK